MFGKSLVFSDCSYLKSVVREQNSFLEDLLHSLVRKLFSHFYEAIIHMQ